MGAAAPESDPPESTSLFRTLDVLLSQQMLPAIKLVAKRCLFTKQYVAYGEIGHFIFFVFCDFPR